MKGEEKRKRKTSNNLNRIIACRIYHSSVK